MSAKAASSLCCTVTGTVDAIEKRLHPLAFVGCVELVLPYTTHALRTQTNKLLLLTDGHCTHTLLRACTSGSTTSSTTILYTYERSKRNEWTYAIDIILQSIFPRKPATFVNLQSCAYAKITLRGALPATAATPDRKWRGAFLRTAAEWTAACARGRHLRNLFKLEKSSC